MVAWAFTESRTIPQRITDISTTVKVPLGTIATARDMDASTNYGYGEFIYMLGVGSTVAGSWVTYTDAYATALLVPNAIGPVAVAMGANVAASYGWYQIQGRSLGVGSTGVADNAHVYTDTAAGTVDDTVVVGDLVKRAYSAGASDTAGSLIEFQIERPYVDDGLGGST